MEHYYWKNKFRVVPIQNDQLAQLGFLLGL